MSREWVVDANVGIKLYIHEHFSENAEALFRGLAQEPPVRLYVPDLFYLECTNILWKYARRPGYSEERARRSLTLLESLDLVVVPTLPLLVSSLDLALQRRISAYDAAYVAVSQSLAVPLVTDDRPLIERLEGSGIEVRWLGDLPADGPDDPVT